MSNNTAQNVEEVLLTRAGLAFLPPGSGATDADTLRAVELQFAEVGYVLSSRLIERMAGCSLSDITRFRDRAITALRKHVGGDQNHTPLFRAFPDRIPDNTRELWWRKVLSHYFQAESQPCIFCDEIGTTHVLSPCEHVVCDACFDGSNYSACPVCESPCDERSPFFKKLPVRRTPREEVRFKRIDLAEDIDEAARQLFDRLCRRRQALSPNDRAAMDAVISAYGLKVLGWLPDAIPLRENTATVFGKLMQAINPAQAFEHAKAYMSTATDVLRLIAVYSGADGSLQAETVFREFARQDAEARFWGKLLGAYGRTHRGRRVEKAYVPVQVKRFKVAKLSRRLRRAVLEYLEALPAQQMTEDMLRHRSYWVWVGQFLHPHEYAGRYPLVAEAFKALRKRVPDGTRAPKFRTWSCRAGSAIACGQPGAIIDLLSERPGEFGRRLDHALRSVYTEDEALTIADGFGAVVPRLATPMLLTLLSHLPGRAAEAPVRVYWPKGKIAKGVATADRRDTLAPAVIEKLVVAIRHELLSRFAGKPAFQTGLIDRRLGDIVAPFNERTASASAVDLPRGSRVPVRLDKTTRLFLHWCEPKSAGSRTDLDLSVAFYDSKWKYVGVCSYYELKLKKNKTLVAQSAGDLQAAPWPNGATEFVDIHAKGVEAIGARYAVMVVNSYAGLPFSRLERGFAGLMPRGDTGGKHFDPRVVELKFTLDGENGVYMPLALDMELGVLHWLDVQSKGQFVMNNVATSNAAISTICPNLLAYFASGTRASMLELALLHAAARCDRVLIREGDLDGSLTEHTREPGEGLAAFHDRVVNRPGRRAALDTVGAEPVLAALYRGDTALPEGSACYALFRDQLTPTLSASDLLS